MQVVILCGGKGTRAYPLTAHVPKPMLPIGGVPILVHLMTLFEEQGHTEFVLAAGHHQGIVREYFRDTAQRWDVQIVDTGNDTDTGDRIRRCRHLLGERFFVTYGDGLADVSLSAVTAFHEAHSGCATVTCVPLVSQFGLLEIAGSGEVLSFREKPVLREHWVNAGFMLLSHDVFEHWEGSSLERDVLPRLTKDGRVFAYRHDGFFKSLDSHKDQQEFEALVQSGQAPWKRQP